MQFFTSDLRSTAGHFERKKSNPKYLILCPKMGSSYYFKRTSVLLHSAIYKPLYGERPKNERKSLLPSWKFCRDDARRSKILNLLTMIPFCTKFNKVQNIFKLILYSKFCRVAGTKFFTAYRAKVPKIGKPFRWGHLLLKVPKQAQNATKTVYRVTAPVKRLLWKASN
jgi:hypothetical protein